MDLGRTLIDVSLLVGLEEGPFYYDSGDPDDDLNHYIDEETIEFLRLGPDLVRELQGWDQEYQCAFDREDFSTAGFASPEVEKVWLERGRKLAGRLKLESPIIGRVYYRAHGVIPAGDCVF
ncbi:hypothetical protein [Actinoalloteichus hymeniacidonis]|uniref:Uncharacterized protein n=1 Tax=Actinoalloteichus hymeniacidonis TaxID=340345 RepID=A0AAC9HLM4_9PSEU|nr:hypothetical protein [Actinoalloteichus hymeniacidonis]AOS61549.1 hypothetical protein TL08_03585 [Actinoalloteichus hymeniacidonis]MBB5910443.1 hypothetical protein [Actinoalloteichus hymeniacidonis]